VKAVIMAGGEGSRLRPLTCNKPKPMVPVAGRPILEHTLDLLKRHGITEVVLTLQFMPTAIMNYFGDGSEFGMRMRYVVENAPLGTAGSVRNAARFLDEPFIVVSGDALTDFDLGSLYRFHRERGAKATLGLTRVPNPVELGIVTTAEDGSIARFLEKPSWGEVFSDTVNTGVYVLDPDVLEMVPEGRPFDFSKDLFPAMLAARRPLFGCILYGYWCDIGNLAQYCQAQVDAMDGTVRLGIAGTRSGPGVWVGNGARISRESVVIPPVLIGEGTTVAAGAVVGPHCVTGRNCNIAGSASLRRAVLWDGVCVGEGAEVRGAVLCDRTQVRAGAKVFETAVIADETVVGENSVVGPGVKVWPCKIIGKAATVRESIVWGNVAAASQVKSTGLAGVPNVDVTPETVTRVCGALGGVASAGLAERGTAVVAADSRASAQMLKQAAACGLTSSGLDVVDLGLGMPPVVRFAVRLLGACCGAAVKRGASGDDSVIVELYDGRGANLSADWQRKLNHALARGDFRRAPADSVGRVTFYPSVVPDYLGSLALDVDAGAVRGRGLRVYSSHHPDAGDIVNMAGERFGLDIRQVGVGDAGDIEELVRADGASIGVAFGPTMEGISLVDESGRRIAGETLKVLLVRAILEMCPGSTAVVPADFTGVAEDLARRLGGRVLRSKTSIASLMGKMLDHSDRAGFSQFRAWFDGLYCLLKLIEWRARRALTFEELVNTTPTSGMVRRTVHCPWEEKGRVMRSLAARLPHDESDLVDGVRVRRQSDWTLIVPDEDEPAYHICTEAASMEVAEEIADSYARKVSELRDSPSEAP
jgi:mannose-1-phosphate guanylyltransferase/phosphomannomutase